MHCAGPEAKRSPGADDLRLQHRLPDLAQLELRPAFEDVPALVLLPVELEAERVAFADKEHLARVTLRLRPNQLVTPRLLYAVGLEGEGFEPLQVRGRQRPLHAQAILRF